MPEQVAYSKDNFIAYYISWCYPPRGKRAYAEISIQTADGRFHTLNVDYKNTSCVSRTHDFALAKKMLKHYLGRVPPREMIERFLDMPSHSIARTTQEDLNRFFGEAGGQESMRF